MQHETVRRTHWMKRLRITIKLNGESQRSRYGMDGAMVRVRCTRQFFFSHIIRRISLSLFSKLLPLRQHYQATSQIAENHTFNTDLVLSISRRGIVKVNVCSYLWRWFAHTIPKCLFFLFAVHGCRCCRRCHLAAAAPFLWLTATFIYRIWQLNERLKFGIAWVCVRDA